MPSTDDGFTPSSSQPAYGSDGAFKVRKDDPAAGSRANVPVPSIDESARARRRREEREAQQDASASLYEGEGALFKGDDPRKQDLGPEYTYSKVRLHRKDDVNIYAETRDKQLGMDSRLRVCIIFGVVLVVLIPIVVSIPPGIFSSTMQGVTPAEWISMITTRASGFLSYITFQGSNYGMEFTTCKYVIVAIAGGALALSGAVYQGSLKNAIASPSTLGVISGANFGRIIYVLFFFSMGAVTVEGGSGRLGDLVEIYHEMPIGEYLLTVYSMSLFSLAGSFIVVGLVLGIATIVGRGRVSNIMMVVTGQVFATILGAVLGLIQYYLMETGDERFELLRSLQAESFSGTYQSLDLLLVGVPILVCMIAMFMMSGRLNLLAFNEEEARSMGVSTTRLRWTMVGVCTLLTAIVTAFCGQVGMIGFFIPHLVRRIVGPDFKYLLPASALGGAAFLVLAYFVVSLFDDSVVTSVGVFTSVLGAIIFLVTVIRQREGRNDEWL